MDTIDKDQTITALQEEIIFLRMIISIMPGNVYWKNAEGTYMGCNTNLAKMLKLPNPEEIIGKKNTDLMSVEMAKEIDDIDNEIMLSKKENAIEESGFDIHGAPAVYLTRKKPLFNPSGKIQGVLGISFDISDRKRMENRLRIAKKKAEAANRAKSQFLAMVSHDLRTPIASMLGFAKLLEQSNLDVSQKQDYGKYITDSGDYLLALIQSLLDYSKLESNKITLMYAPFNFKKLLERVVGMLGGVAKLKDLPIQSNYANDFPEFLIGSENAWQTVLINLIANAVKFTEQGHISVTVTCLTSSSKKLKLQIAIKDTGIGIPLQEQKAIFKPFYQLGDTYVRNASLTGTGLGLATVAKLLKRMKGKITVESKVGEGSTFYITADIPIASPQQQMEQPKKITAYTTKIENPYVLVIEDHSLIQLIHRQTLEGLGCRVDVIGAARPLLESLECKYDLLFIDIGLPEIAGFDLIKKIRQRGNAFAQVPIVVLTGYSEDSERQQCLSAGANEVFVKPINQDTFKEILHRYLGVQQSPA